MPSNRIRICALGVLLSLSCSHGQLLLEDPGLSGEAAEAHWDVFGVAQGITVPPPSDIVPDQGWSGSQDVPPEFDSSAGSFVSAPLLNEVGGFGAFITSSQNIYSFTRSTSFEIEARYDGNMENLVFQFVTLGTEIDYGSITLSYGLDFSVTVAPSVGFITESGDAGGSFGGASVSYLAQWDLSGVSGGVSSDFRIAFNASSSSSSLAEARIDASDIFNSVAPPQPVIQNDENYLVYLGIPFELQIEATGEPTSFLQGGLPVGLSLNNLTGLITGTVEQGTSDTPGDVEVAFIASNQLDSELFTTTLTVLDPSTYGDYMTERGLSGNDALTTADIDQDGLSNLEEYFFGTEPLISDYTNANHTLSYIDLPDGPDTMTYTFNWNRQAIDIVAELEFADASLNFTSDALVGSLEFAADGTAIASVITEETTEGFLRLNLTLQP
ncbi:MAG: putative Ig domain-containing protein [Verrucomicrobiota bacterium]